MKHRYQPFLLFFITVALASCVVSTPSPVSISAEPVQTTTSNPSSSITQEANQQALEGIAVIDGLGREVTFDAPPERIVIAGRATMLVADALYMFPEADERLVSFEGRAQRDFSFYPIVDPNFEAKSLLEQNAGPEQIAPFHPDLVLLKSYMAESLGDPLEQIGLPVLYVDLENPEQFYRDVAILGEMLANQKRAREIIDFYTSRLQRIDQAIEGLDGNEPPNVLVVQYSDKGGEVAFTVPSASWLQTMLVQRAGGNPVWLEAAQKGGWTVVGFEQIAAWDPDQIYVIYYPDDPRPIVENLMAQPNWQALRAVQSGAVFGFAGDFMSWDQPDSRWILGLTWLATEIHPEVVGDIDLLDEITTFYHQMYGLDPSVIEAEILPILQIDLE
jgi:iron complex transport system substrate-binding protein